jgi:hypothetical protein
MLQHTIDVAVDAEQVQILDMYYYSGQDYEGVLKAEPES